MTLRLFSTISGSGEDTLAGLIGAVIVNVDVGGMARAYPNALWATNDGTYLQERLTGSAHPRAFEDFIGLEEIFLAEKLALWEGQGRQVIWVPLLMTEDSGPIWVGRAVDPSPVSQFRNTLIIRVLTIAFIAVVLVLLSARWIASRISLFGQSLTERIGRVLQEDQAVRFDWKGPREIKDLGSQLTALSLNHSHHAEEQREHARQLEESNRYKSEFLANVSHELRTPLNSILLLSKMLREGSEALTSEQQHQLRVIHEAGADLKELIDNILDLSRIEAGQASFHLEQIDVRQLITELVELLKPQFDEKGLDFSAEFAPDVPPTCVSDLAKIRQILKNFLSNALKFTHHGQVVIRAFLQQESADHPLCIAVIDSGIGIPTDKHRLIFDAFKQADGSTSREYGGTGLGLSISRELAHLLGGQIELASEAGQGATFTLCLPLEYEPATLRPQAYTPQQPRITAAAANKPTALASGSEAIQSIGEFKGERVLLVDDDLRNLLAMTPLLEGWGLEVTAAGDGNEALETLAEDPEFSIVLMDIMMPELDGYDTIKKIREDSRLNSLSIIALTAKNTDADREQCIEAGADDFLAKPIDTKELKELIRNHLPE